MDIRLDDIRVAKPCKAEWAGMEGDDRTRHCSQCGLNVFNIEGMTRFEAQELIRRSEGRLCVRFYRRRDGTILTKDCPRGVRVVARKLGWGLAAALLLAVGAVAMGFSRMRTHDDDEFSGRITDWAPMRWVLEKLNVRPSPDLYPTGVIVCPPSKP